MADHEDAAPRQPDLDEITVCAERLHELKGAPHAVTALALNL